MSSWRVLRRDHIGICKCQVGCQSRHCKHTCILLTLQTRAWVLERLCCNAHTLISCVRWRHTISDRQLRSSVFIYVVCFKVCCHNHAQEALSCCSLTQPSKCCGCCCCVSYLKSWVSYFYDSIAHIGYSHMTYYTASDSASMNRFATGCCAYNIVPYRSQCLLPPGPLAADPPLHAENKPSGEAVRAKAHCIRCDAKPTWAKMVHFLYIPPKKWVSKKWCHFLTPQKKSS